MSKIVKNRSKGLMSINLGDGSSVHLRPKETIELTDKQLKSSEVIKHLAKGRLVEDGVPKVKKSPKPSKAKVADPPPKVDAKPEVKTTQADKKDSDTK